MSNASTLKQIKIEASGAIFYLPYYVARDKGYFAAEGLEIEFVKRGSNKTEPGIQLIEDHELVTSFGGPSPFEEGQTALYNACEWGQVRRTYDGNRGGQVVSKRAAIATQAIVVRPDSPYNIPQDLANVPVGVSFHHGSHYVAIQLLEGFLPKEEIKVVHVDGGGGGHRFLALHKGLIETEAVAVMEPWVTVAKKLGYKIIAESHYFGLEIGSPELDAESFDALNRAIRRAVQDIQADPLAYTNYLISEVPEDIVHLEPSDFSRNRLRYAVPAPYTEAEFRRSYNWLVSWGLIKPDASFNKIVDNRVSELALV